MFSTIEISSNIYLVTLPNNVPSQFPCQPYAVKFCTTGFSKLKLVKNFSGSIVSRIVKFYTKKEFGHVSIALDKELERMYSFGRLNPYNTFIGGFVHEYIHSGTFYRFRNTTCEVLRVRVTDEQYAKLEEVILKMEAEKEKYKFNIPGLFAVSINKKISKENH